MSRGMVPLNHRLTCQISKILTYPKPHLPVQTGEQRALSSVPLRRASMSWWPWNLIGGKDETLKDLDPSLREFLERESPSKYKTNPAAEPAPVPERKPLISEPEPLKTGPDGSMVPAQSLFQDGRYAHLWKTYRTPYEVDQEGKSDQERLTDLVDAFKDRKKKIGQAAFENCSFEFSAIDDCYDNGSWMDVASMCRGPKGAFYKCYNMQTVRSSHLRQYVPIH